MATDTTWENALFTSGYGDSTHFQILSQKDGQVLQDTTLGSGACDGLLLPGGVVGLLRYGSNHCVYTFDLETKALGSTFPGVPSWSSGSGIDSFRRSDGMVQLVASDGGGRFGVWTYDSDTKAASLVHSMKLGTSYGEGTYYNRESLVTTSSDKALRVYDVERFSEVGSLANCAFTSGWFRTAISQARHSIFVTHCSSTTQFRQIDLRSLTYVVESKGTPANNNVRSLGIIDNQEDGNMLVVAGSGGFVGMYDLRRFDQPVFFHNSAHCNVYARPERLNDNSFVTGGYNTDKTVRAWSMVDGSQQWERKLPNQYGCNTLINLNPAAHGYHSSRGLFPPSTSIGEHFSSENCSENKQFLLEHMDLVHDAKIVMSGANGQLGSFRTLQSFIVASQMSDNPEATEFKEVLEIQIALTCDSIALEEEKFGGLLLGAIQTVDLLEQPDEIMDLCEVLSQLKMKKLLWFVSEKIRDASKEASLEVSFSLFKAAFERFEEEEEGESDDDAENGPIVFRSVIAAAAFEGLKTKQEEPIGRRKRRWLGNADLLQAFLVKTDPISLRTHPQLEIPEELECLPPNELLAAAFSRFAETTTNPNVELSFQMRSDGDQTSVFGHIEALVLSFDYFKMMLSFEGTERELFERDRCLELEELTKKSIQLLVNFSYVGNFGDESPPLLDVLLVLRLAEKTHDLRVTDYCLATLNAIDTSEASFMDDLLRVGNTFEDVQSRVQILEAWVSQGSISMKKLQKLLARAVEIAEATMTSNEMEGMRGEIRDLKRVVRALRSELQQERTARQELEEQGNVARRLLEERFESQIAEIMRRLDDSS